MPFTEIPPTGMEAGLRLNWLYAQQQYAYERVHNYPKQQRTKDNIMPSTYQFTKVNSPIEDVWEVIKLFHKLDWAPKVISSIEPIGDIQDGAVGAKRLINGVFPETLKEIDEEKYLIRYSIDDGPSPISSQDVSEYIDTIQLLKTEKDDVTKIEWSSSWVADDDSAVEFTKEIYKVFLDSRIQI